MLRRIAGLSFSLVVLGAVLAPTTAGSSAPASPDATFSPVATSSPSDAATRGDASVAALGAKGSVAPVNVAAPAAATVSVVPDTNVVAGQVVTVTATGLPAAQVAVLECGSDSTTAQACDLSGLTFIAPDANGALSTSKTLHRRIPTVDGHRDCAATTGACELVIASTSAQFLVRHSLQFDSNAPFPDSTITVTPNTGLRDGQSLAVTGSGFAANAPIYVRECATVDPSCTGAAPTVSSDASGAFSVQLPARLRVRGADGAATNCLVVDCMVRAETADDPDYLADAPISFDPAQPPPPTPRIVVTPSTGLLHDQEVTVTGTGFAGADYVELDQCGADISLFCGDNVGFANLDTQGGFTATIRVSRLVSTFGTTPSPQLADCVDVACAIVANAFSNDDAFDALAKAPIEFDPSPPPPPPAAATVTPDHDLPYRADVAVHGTGFTPGTSVYAQFCAASDSDFNCASSYGQANAAAGGTVDLTITVKRRFSSDFSGSVIDCVAVGTECWVELHGERSYQQTHTTVTFDPNAPIPPPPSVIVTPDHDLGWRTTSTVSGTNLPPGPTTVQQCGTVTFPDGSSFFTCTNPQPALVDDHGNLSTTYTLRRQPNIGVGVPIDCAQVPCTLQVGYGDPDESARVPLTFDPNSQPPPPPILSYWPPGNLRDGRRVMLVGQGFTPNATIGLTECRAGATAIADSCDLGKAFTATADASGAFAIGWTPFGSGGNALGAFDCTAAPASCVLAAANANDLSEFTSMPLTFAAPELRVMSTTVAEGTDAMMPSEGHVMVELSEPVGSPVEVAWHTSPGTAGDADFTMRHGRVVIPAGETEAMIHVQVTADAIDEPTEQFTVDVDTAPGARIVDGSATVKIRDDDRAPGASIDDSAGVEANGSVWTAVHLAPPSGRSVVVKYVAHHGTARSGSDYVRAKGELVFAPGETTKYVGIALVDDHIREQTEAFTIELYDARNARIDRAVGRMTIHDDD